MKLSAEVYTNRKGEAKVMLRIPIDVASALVVDRAEAHAALKEAISEALTDRRGVGFSDDTEE